MFLNRIIRIIYKREANIKMEGKVEVASVLTRHHAMNTYPLLN